MWVSAGSTVTKLRASDGAVLKTISVTAGAGALVFDGANIWVAGSSITKLRASDGSVVATVSIPQAAGAMVFDGTNIWPLLGFFPTGSVAKIRASDATLLKVVALTQVPESIAFDGANIWVGQGDGTAIKLQISDGATIATYARLDCFWGWRSTARTCGSPTTWGV